LCFALPSPIDHASIYIDPPMGCRWFLTKREDVRGRLSDQDEVYEMPKPWTAAKLAHSILYKTCRRDREAQRGEKKRATVK
jgi:hypothetical protein